MIKLHRDSQRILLTYLAENASPEWVDNKLSADGSVTFRRIFTFSIGVLVQDCTSGQGNWES